VNSSWHIDIQEEVTNIVVTIVMHMAKSTDGCVNTKAYEVVGGICESEIVRS